MADKLQPYLELAARTAEEITGSQRKWMSFLRTVSRLYKYPYQEQLMIYAQRPEATACAGYELWNRQMGRYVKKGARGIALLDLSGAMPKIRYVFDVADTGCGANARTPQPWQLRQEHEETVRKALTDRFEVGGITLADQLEETARFVVDDYWYANREDILSIVDGSFLGDYDDEETIRCTFCEAAAVSTGYVLLHRCDLEPENRYEPEDFMQVCDFNTPQTAAALGSCISTSAQSILRQTEIAVKRYEKQKERSEHDGQTAIHSQRGLSDPGAEAAGAGPTAPGPIRQTAEAVSAEAPSGAVEQSAPVRESVRSPERDRQGGRTDGGEDSSRSGEESRTDPADEGRESPAVGEGNEQASPAGRGADPSENPGRLTESQVSFFPSEAQQIAYLVNAEDAEQVPSAFSLPQKYLDLFLQVGSNTADHRTRLVSEFSKQKPVAEQVQLVKILYHGGYGIEEGGRKISAWYGEDGIRIAAGNGARYAKTVQIVPWFDAARRIGELLEEGRFATKQEVTDAPEAERKRIAENLWYLASDLSDSGRQQNLLPTVCSLRGGFQEEVRQLMEVLASPEGLRNFQREFQMFLQSYEENKPVLRFYHDPKELSQQVTELSMPRGKYRSQLDNVLPEQAFITEDELNQAIACGSGVSGGKRRITSFFRHHADEKERAAFLKEEYGVGGRSHALSGSPWSSEDHDAGGQQFQKHNCADVLLTWEKTARRIDDLIRKDRYLTPKEKEKMAVEDQPRTEEKRTVREQLKVPAVSGKSRRKHEMEVR